MPVKDTVGVYKPGVQLFKHTKFHFQLVNMNGFLVFALCVASATASWIPAIHPAAHIPSGTVSVGHNGALVAGPAGSVATDNGLGGHGAGSRLSGPSGDVRTVGGHTALTGPGNGHGGWAGDGGWDGDNGQWNGDGGWGAGAWGAGAWGGHGGWDGEDDGQWRGDNGAWDDGDNGQWHGDGAWGHGW